MVHYTYRITNIKDKKHYYGSRSTNIEPKNDIGYIYFSSSSDKEFIKEQKTNSTNFKYKVIKVFNTIEEALRLEIKLHKKFKVRLNEAFYNKAEQTSEGFKSSFKGRHHTEEYKNKMKLLHTGRKLTEEHKMKISNTRKERIRNGQIERPIGEKNGMFGKKLSKETRIKISEKTKGKVVSEEARAKHSKNNKGAKNAMALIIKIYNEKDELMFESNGGFAKMCKDNNLPKNAFYRSYNDNTKLFQTKDSYTRAKNKGILKYEGWYAIKEAPKD